MRNLSLKGILAGGAFVGAVILPAPVRADVITEWNDKACAIVAKVGRGPPGTGSWLSCKSPCSRR